MKPALATQSVTHVMKHIYLVLPSACPREDGFTVANNEKCLSLFLIGAQNRCVNMIAHLFNAPLGDSETAVGVGTVGSSEAIMLAGLAFKRKWQNKRRAEGKPCDKPNIVTGANVQVSHTVYIFTLYLSTCLLHFCRCWPVGLFG